MSAQFRIYSYCVGGAFWLALVARLALDPSQLGGATKLAPLVALAVAGEVLVVRGRDDGAEPALSLSAAAHVAAAVLLAPAAAALAAALGVVIGDGLRRDGHRHLLINSAMFGGSTWAAAWAFRGADGGHMRWVFASTYPLVVLIAVRYLLSSAIFAGGMATLGEGRFARLIGRTILEEVPSATGEGSLGVLVAFALGQSHVLLLFLVPLVGALFFARANLERLRKETDRALHAMADVIDARDPSTIEHSERVAELVSRFATAIDLPRREAERLVAAARFHDLGKIAVDKRTLASSERLNADEIAQIRLHPRLSAQLLRPFSFAREIAEFAALHHERFDGDGYYRVRGAQVPVEAHVLIAADSLDAMTSSRPYRPAVTREDAVAELLDKAGTQFHPLVARAFAAVLLGRPLTETLTGAEVAELRSSFSHVAVLATPPWRRLLEPRLGALVGLVLTLATAGIPGIPQAVLVSVAGATAALLARWLALELRLRTRRRRAIAALAREAHSEDVLADAGFAGWVVYVSTDPGRLEPAAPNVPEADLGEVRGWLRLGIPDVRRRLASGAYAISRNTTDSDEEYLVLGLRNEPREYERILVDWLADELAKRPTVRPVMRASARGGKRALALIELGVYDRLRYEAGQLIAERVIAEAERQLRSVLRASDAIIRTEDDAFAISLIAGRASLESVEARLRNSLEEIALPRRLGDLTPRIRIAHAADAAAIPELAAVEHRLLPSQLPV